MLRNLPQVTDDRLMVGPSTFDDAGIFRLRPDLALVQTVDFFPPVVDDPYLFGQIAAANSLSDVYAMGGDPLTAMSLVGFPIDELPLTVLGEILRGGGDKVAEAGALIIGGHTVKDVEIKFGLSVTGTVHPDQVLSNAGAKAGDALILTKPLGMGIMTTAYRKRAISADDVNRAGAVMATLNKAAVAAIRALSVPGAVHAATDITGFGLLGHARNIAAASDVTISFNSQALPFFENALELAGKKMNSGAYKQNQEFLANEVALASALDERVQRVIYDAETSGGLLIAVAPEHANALLQLLKAKGAKDSVAVGHVEARGSSLLKVS